MQFLASSTLTGQYTGIDIYEPTPPDVSFGIYISTNGQTYQIPLVPTEGSPDNIPYIGPLFISEVPILINEPALYYVKLSTSISYSYPLDLSGYKLTGEISFDFPEGFVVYNPTDLYLLSEDTNLNDFLQYMGLPSITILGYYNNTSNGTNSLQITSPIQGSDVVTDTVTYPQPQVDGNVTYTLSVYKRNQPTTFGLEQQSWQTVEMTLIPYPPPPQPSVAPPSIINSTDVPHESPISDSTLSDVGFLPGTSFDQSIGTVVGLVIAGIIIIIIIVLIFKSVLKTRPTEII